MNGNSSLKIVNEKKVRKLEDVRNDMIKKGSKALFIIKDLGTMNGSVYAISSNAESFGTLCDISKRLKGEGKYVIITGRYSEGCFRICTL